MADTREGGCLCGAARYRTELEKASAAICHCADCRRHTGTSFSLYVTVPARHFDWITRPSGIARASEKAIRRFCEHCGTPLTWESAEAGKTMSVLAGTLDDAAGIVPSCEIWTKSRLPWLSPLPGVPQYETDNI